MYLCICVFVFVYVFVYLCMNVCIYVFVYLYLFICICVFVCVFVCFLFLETRRGVRRYSSLLQAIPQLEVIQPWKVIIPYLTSLVSLL